MNDAPKLELKVGRTRNVYHLQRIERHNVMGRIRIKSLTDSEGESTHTMVNHDQTKQFATNIKREPTKESKIIIDPTMKLEGKKTSAAAANIAREIVSLLILDNEHQWRAIHA